MTYDFEPLKEAQILQSGFFQWIVERHQIYRNRLEGKPFGEWSDDHWLENYKFTNPFRENDRETIWMRKNFTPVSELNSPYYPKQGLTYRDATLKNNIVNAALYRMVGTKEFAEEFLFSHGWITENNYNPKLIKEIIEKRIRHKERCFTGAYIITNQGIKAPKSEVVIDRFITPLYEDIVLDTTNFPMNNTASFMQQRLMHYQLMDFQGFGGGGFMAYEVVCDLTYMPTYRGDASFYESWEELQQKATLEDFVSDRYFWANAGPGALRGLNRIWGRFLTSRMNFAESVAKMKHLLSYKKLIAEISAERGYKPINPKDIDMRCIEHSLCEYDKYMRVLRGEGRPRSVTKYKEGQVYPVERGPVE